MRIRTSLVLGYFDYRHFTVSAIINMHLLVGLKFYTSHLLFNNKYFLITSYRIAYKEYIDISYKLYITPCPKFGFSFLYIFILQGHITSQNKITF